MAAVHEHGGVLVRAIACLPSHLSSPIGARTAQAPARRSPPPPAVAVAPLPSDAEIERFLLEAQDRQDEGRQAKGSPARCRPRCPTETLTHDAHIQTIDEYKREFRTDGGRVRLPRQLEFNVAAYKIDRLLGLNMVPVSVQRSYRSTPRRLHLVAGRCDDGRRETGRRKRSRRRTAPTGTSRTTMMRLFDQLIANIDRNIGNIVYTKDWRLWPIDHTRAFRKNTDAEDAGPHHALRPAGVRAVEDARSRHAEARGRQVSGRRANQIAPRPPRRDRQEARTHSGRSRPVRQDRRRRPRSNPAVANRSSGSRGRPYP